MLTYTHNTLLLFPYYNLVKKNLPNFHNHTFWEFAIFTEGDSVNHTPEGDEVFHPLSVLLMRPFKDVHTILDDPNQTNAHYDVYVHSEKMQELCSIFKRADGSSLYEELLTSETTPTFRIPLPFLSHLETQFAVMEHPECTKETKENIHSAIVISLLSLYTTSLGQQKTLPSWLKTFLQTLKDPLHFQDKIDTLINDIPYSHSQICREFKKLLGKTVVEYFNEQKIIYSAHLLMNTNYRIIDISNILGYASPKNFIQQFTKHFSCSPSIYRKNVHIAPTPKL